MTIPIKSLADHRHDAPERFAQAAPAGREPSSAIDAIRAAFKVAADCEVRDLIKDRASDYAREPRQLDALGDDLRTLPPRHLVTALAYIVRNPKPYRWTGNGGEIPAINLAGAMLYARHSRRIANRIARRKA